jgi:integrase
MYRIWRRHLSGVFGHQRPEELTQADIVQYLEECARSSFRGEISLLSAAYWRWIRQRKVAFNPCAGVRTTRKRSKRSRLLDEGELDQILEVADERITVAVELAFATGLRISDLCALRWSDFDTGGHVKTRKTGARQAFQHTEGLDAVLARARALQARVASPFVLCDASGQPHTRNSLGRRFRLAAKKAGVADVQFRDLRAAAATARDQEEGETGAQAFLGHTDARTTRIYLRGRRVNTVRPVTRKSR